jgi:UDP-N-acetyl-2-amino-2-deoxyglucuronate dehydrogenase
MTQGQRLRVALVGCGRISARHVQVIRAIEELELVGVCDLVEERARAASSAGGGVPAYTSVDELLAAQRPDVVSVLTESGSHARVAAAIAPHVKALVIEKPMALTLDDADRLIEACDAHHTRLFVVKQNRFNKPVVRLRKALEAGRFGKLVMGTVRVRWCRTQEYYDQAAWRGTWKDDGGVLTNQASHHVDLLQWMMGPVESVKAYTATRLARVETEDTGVVILRFASGALGVIEATTATRPKDLEGSLSILGEKGSVVIGGFAVNRLDTWAFSEPLPEDARAQEDSVAPPNVYGFGHYEFYRDMIECLRTGRRAMLDGLEGRKSLELINAIYESASTGAEVRLHYVARGVRLGH